MTDDARKLLREARDTLRAAQQIFSTEHIGKHTIQRVDTPLSQPAARTDGPCQACEDAAKVADEYRWDDINNECCEGNMGWLLGKVSAAIRSSCRHAQPAASAEEIIKCCRDLHVHGATKEVLAKIIGALSDYDNAPHLKEHYFMSTLEQNALSDLDLASFCLGDEPYGERDILADIQQLARAVINTTNPPTLKENMHSDHACLLEIHRTVHSWADVPVINEHDQWTVKRVKELLLAYQTATKDAP